MGIGSGLNLPFYGRAVERLYGVDPRRELWAPARGRIARVSFPIEFIEASAERVPMGDGSIDTVVTTWTLCSIPEARLALLEMKRLLRAEGRLVFIEHGLAPDPRVVAWQGGLGARWRRIAGGCHLNRKIDRLILDAGFRFTESDQGYGSAREPWPTSTAASRVRCAAARPSPRPWPPIRGDAGGRQRHRRPDHDRGAFPTAAPRRPVTTHASVHC